jgi:hypothetical protein
MNLEYALCVCVWHVLSDSEFLLLILRIAPGLGFCAVILVKCASS